MLVSVENVSKGFAGHQVLQNIDLKIEDHDRIGLIGVNGAGKSTLLKLIIGQEQPDEGEIATAGDMTFGFLEQNTGLARGSTIMEEMRKVFQLQNDCARQMRELEAAMASLDHEAQREEYQALSARYAVVQEQFTQNEGYLVDVKIKTILNGMGFGDKAFDTVIDTLSGGEKTRLAIARLLLEEPSLLILDEPTNHLDFKTLMWLESYLKDYKGALLIVSHDRYFLDKLVTSICEIERGRLTRYKGGYTKYLQLKEEQQARQQKEYLMQQEEIAAMQDYISKNMVRASTSNRAKSRLHALERMEVIERPAGELKPPKIRFSFERQPVKDVLHVRDLTLQVGRGTSTKVLARHLNLDLMRGDKIGLIGANGVGKSSLLKAMQGLIPVLEGTVEWGRHVKIAYFDQENTRVNPDNTVLEELWRRHPTEKEQEIRARLGAVLLTGENVFKKVGNLSGGEKAKLAFAILVFEYGNVLILDEPTNHMDLVTKEVIEEALQSYEGTILMVSHDRYLLNKVPNKIVEMLPGQMDLYNGNFDYYLERSAILNEQRAAEKAAEKQEARQSEGAAQYYRSKQQRSEDAKRKRQLKELEETIAAFEEQISALEAEIADPATGADFQLLQEKCLQLEEVKNQLSESMDRWLELSES